MTLASKWADNPELVEEAVIQDSLHKPITVKKGQPLVSKWAVDDGNDTDKDGAKTPNNAEEERIRIVRERLLAKKKAAEEKKAQELRREKDPENKKNQASSSTNELAARLGIISIQSQDHEVPEHSRKITSPSKLKKKQNKSPKKPVDQEEYWQDKEEVIEPGEKVRPTKAAQDFASRLGIKLDVPTADKSPKKRKDEIRKQRELEKQRLREKKSRELPEWHAGKPGTKVDHSQRSEPPKRANKVVQKPKEEKPIVADFSSEMKILDDIAKGNKVDWADFDDF